MSVPEIYRKMGIAEIRRLKILEEEKRKLKQLVADLSLDKQMLQDILRKKVKACSVRPELVENTRDGASHRNCP